MATTVTVPVPFSRVYLLLASGVNVTPFAVTLATPTLSVTSNSTASQYVLPFSSPVITGASTLSQCAVRVMFSVTA